MKDFDSVFPTVFVLGCLFVVGLMVSTSKLIG